jgi:hypothetical protein
MEMFGAEHVKREKWYERYDIDLDDAVRGILFFLVVLVISFFAFCSGCLVSEDVAIRALETQGFSNVRVTDKHWILVGMQGCSDSDAAKFDAEATNSAGRRVQLYVCAGWLWKGATVRTQ